jgi:hypothetical protein
VSAARKMQANFRGWAVRKSTRALLLSHHARMYGADDADDEQRQRWRQQVDGWGARCRDARNTLLQSSTWVRHMCLQADGRDPPGIQVRPYRGLEGVAYLQGGALSPFTWVFAPVIECLKQHGYVENKTLFAEPCECLPPSCCVSGDFLAPRLSD